METNHIAMINTANEKYRKILEYVYRLKITNNCTGSEYDKIIKLIDSIHEDEIYLIVRLCESERMSMKPELSIPDFMKK